MYGLLTMDEVLEADLPAAGGDLYRYVPKKGFFRANTGRFGPSWLQVGWPAYGDQVMWSHQEACDCRFCSTPDKGEMPDRETAVRVA